MLVTDADVSRKAVRAAPKLNILLGPDETSIQDSSVDDHYSYRPGGASRPYIESTLTEPADRGRLHSSSATSRCRLTQRADGELYSDCPGRLSSVEMRTCGCSLVSCPPPPPPPVSGAVTIARRCQDPASGLYALRRSPVADHGHKQSVYWQVSGRNDPPPCQRSFDVPRRTNLAADRHMISGENDGVITGNRMRHAESVGPELDATSKPDTSPDLVLNGRLRDQKLEGSNSSACTSGQDDRRRNTSTVQKRFNNQQTLDGK